MTRLIWCTDVHFDCLKDDKTFKFGKMLAGRGDACVITGDIAHGDTVCSYITEFQAGFGGDVYFVLGNHDRWNSSFEQVDNDIRLLCKEKPKLHWLGDGLVYSVGNTQLCGVDGWYDYQAGLTGDRINSVMKDWYKIEEIKANFAVFQMGFANPLIEQLRTLGQESAVEARRTLYSCKANKPVLFATHMPPYAEASWHEGKNQDVMHLPFYTNIALGYVLKTWARENPDTQLTTICGHTHSPGEYRQRDNHLVLTGKSQYGNPQVSKVFDL